MGNSSAYRLVAMLSIGVIACGPGSSPTDGGCPAPQLPPTPTNTRTAWFVFNTITIEQTAGANQSLSGFNLDGFFSDGSGSSPNDCLHDDRASAIDPDQNCSSSSVTRQGRCTHSCDVPGCAPAPRTCQGGVDNQLPQALSAIDAITPGVNGEPFRTRQILQQAIDRHEYVLLLQLSDIDGANGAFPRDDAMVTAAVYVGLPVFSDRCTNGIEAGRTFRIDRRSLVAPAMSLQDAPFRTRGSIVNGRVRLEAPEENSRFPLRVPWANAGGQVGWMPLRAQQARLRFDLQNNGNGTNGNFGGFVPAEEILRDNVYLEARYRDVFISLLSSIADIPLNGICADRTNQRFGAVSGGFGFTLLPAQIDATPIAEQPTAGACGSNANPFVDAGQG